MQEEDRGCTAVLTKLSMKHSVTKGKKTENTGSETATFGEACAVAVLKNLFRRVAMCATGLRADRDIRAQLAERAVRMFAAVLLLRDGQNDE